MLHYYYLNIHSGYFFRFLILRHSLNQNTTCLSFVPMHSPHLAEVLLYCKYDIFILILSINNLYLILTMSTFLYFLFSIRDLNPLYDVTTQHNYKDKYYKKLMPLSEKYSEVTLYKISPKPFFPTLSGYFQLCLSLCVFMYLNLIENMQLLPWGGKITSESMKFFSPIVIWTTVASNQPVHDVLFSAFVDYYKVLI